METSSSKSHNNNNNNNNNNHSPEKRKANESTVFGVTKSESVRGCLHWKIVRFKDLDKRVGEYCESPEFTVGDYKWSLFLYPNGSKDDAKNYISIFLSCLNIFHEVTINFTVTFISINSSGDKVLGPIKKTFGEDELDWGWSKALDHQAMNACFLNNNNNNVNNNNNNSNNNNNNNNNSNNNSNSNSNNSNYNNCNEVDEGCLFVKCDVEVFGEWRTALESESSIRVPSCSVREDFDRLLVEHPHADVLFKVQDHDFHSHKAILSVRSSVFRGMFASSMREGREGVVVVDDVEPAVFKELLKFIYTGCCSKLIEERPLDILTVADKYDLPRLKLLSEELLLRRLTMANAPSTLSHADMFHATQLKKCVLEFIANRFFEVIGTEGFKEWTIDNPHLISEIHEYMVGKSNSKAESTGQSKSKKSVQKRRRTST